MPTIFNTLIKCAGALGIAGVGYLVWKKAVAQPCDMATSENRYVGGQMASRVAGQIDPIACQVVGAALVETGQVISNYGQESLMASQKRGGGGAARLDYVTSSHLRISAY